MHESDALPPETTPNAARVAALVREIDARDNLDRALLLDDLLCVAWPTRRGQCQ